ncbi:hypothetical protein [Aquella oligotrophica]|uniref:hypothetical protein n=1 Tax=Aquella oligotrophica TaxID=2067065 RepID=UPI0013152234|nr:hypothetical protein [Aquella oligotrophica]
MRKSLYNDQVYLKLLIVINLPIIPQVANENNAKAPVINAATVAESFGNKVGE